MNANPLAPSPPPPAAADPALDLFARAILDARQHVEEEFDDGFDLGPLPEAYTIDPPTLSAAE